MSKREHQPEALPESDEERREREINVVAQLWFKILLMPQDARNRQDKIDEAQSAYDALDDQDQLLAGKRFDELKLEANIKSPVFTQKKPQEK